MADQNTKDQEFEEYLAGKTSLSALYQQSDAGEPSRMIDNAILTAAKQEVQKHSSASSHRGFRWYVPMALAASIVLAVIVIRIVPVDNTQQSDHLADNSSQNEARRAAASKATPDLMLQNINTLLAEGKNKEAQEEYESFTELFPKYEINYQKYPNLKKFAEK